MATITPSEPIAPRKADSLTDYQQHLVAVMIAGEYNRQGRPAEGEGLDTFVEQAGKDFQIVPRNRGFGERSEMIVQGALKLFNEARQQYNENPFKNPTESEYLEAKLNSMNQLGASAAK